MMKMEVVESRLREMDVDFTKLESQDGGVALFCDAGARIMGIWPDAEGPNLLWTNPVPPKNPHGNGAWTDWDTGGAGGDRLWFGPEYRWFYDGTPKKNLENWRVPPFMDPGNYQMKFNPEQVSFSQYIRISHHSHALVERTFSIEPVVNKSFPDLKAFTLRENRHLRLENPESDLMMDLWNITQVPAGAWLIVPTTEQPVPGISYEENPGEINSRAIAAKDYFRWKVTGKGNLKGSLPVSIVKGTAVILQKLGDGQFGLIIRRFLPSPQADYNDALFEEQVSGQCIQWWDGFGFGEIEVHSPTLSASDKEIREQHYIHAWIGLNEQIRAIANQWLNCTLPDSVFE